MDSNEEFESQLIPLTIIEHGRTQRDHKLQTTQIKNDDRRSDEEFELKVLDHHYRHHYQRIRVKWMIK